MSLAFVIDNYSLSLFLSPFPSLFFSLSISLPLSLSVSFSPPPSLPLSFSISLSRLLSLFLFPWVQEKEGEKDWGGVGGGEGRWKRGEWGERRGKIGGGERGGGTREREEGLVGGRSFLRAIHGQQSIVHRPLTSNYLNKSFKYRSSRCVCMYILFKHIYCMHYIYILCIIYIYKLCIILYVYVLYPLGLFFRDSINFNLMRKMRQKWKPKHRGPELGIWGLRFCGVAQNVTSRANLNIKITYFWASTI